MFRREAFTPGQVRPFEQVDKLMRTYPEQVSAGAVAPAEDGCFDLEVPAWGVAYVKAPAEF